MVLYLATTLGNPGIKLTNQQQKILGVDAGKSAISRTTIIVISFSISQFLAGGFQTVASSVPFGTPVTPNIKDQATPIATPLSGVVTPAHHYYTPVSLFKSCDL